MEQIDQLLAFAHSIISSHIHHKILTLARGCVALLNGYLSIIGAFILIIAALHGTIKVLFTLLTHKKKGIPSFHHVRIEMGNLIALGLELLVATDVLETLTKVLQRFIFNIFQVSLLNALQPSQETHEYSFELLGKIGAVAAFRTALAFFLAREVRGDARVLFCSCRARLRA